MEVADAAANAVGTEHGQAVTDKPLVLPLLSNKLNLGLREDDPQLRPTRKK